MSQDSLATSSRPRTAEPSTDSLSESQTSNKYATYTKARHVKGSVESIKNARQEPVQTTVPGYNKIKTKIPVYLNQAGKPKGLDSRHSRDQQKWVRLVPKPDLVKNRSTERKVPGSLMNATKSSSAKIVPKVLKETPKNNAMTKSQRSGHSSRYSHEEKENSLPRDIPVMERSGTFLKDEPTFGDKTTNLNITQ